MRDKPYYLHGSSPTLRCKACHKYWPDKCTCPKPIGIGAVRAKNLEARK